MTANTHFNGLNLSEITFSEMEAIEGGSRVGDVLHSLWDGACDYFGLK